MTGITQDPNEFIWAEKYRPKTIDECILTDDVKANIKALMSKGALQTLLFSGSAGTGKTTLAKAICDEIGADWIIINGSLDGGVLTLRTKITQFASTVSFTGSKKVVILDEADRTSIDFQEGARNIFDTFSANCTFILTCNYPHKIIEPLRSRCALIDFKLPNETKPKIAMYFLKRVCQILEIEGVEYDKRVVAELVQKYFPDFRKCLNELQHHSSTGKVDSSVLVNFSDEEFNKIVDALKNKKFNDIRKWVASNSDMDTALIFRKFYDMAAEKMEPKSLPEMILVLAEYQYKSAHVADQEINMAAFFTTLLMGNISWK